MTTPPGTPPNPNPDRTARQAAALRANLLKRKDQARQREAAKTEPEQAPALPNQPERSE
jgi:hypothetical protein